MSQGLHSTSPVFSSGFRWWRWFWMTPTLLFVTWAAVAIAVAELKAGSEIPSLLCGLVALGAGFFAFGLLGLGGAVLVQSSTLRADKAGLKHCLLPTIPWHAIRGLDIRRYIPRANVGGSETRYALVIACNREFLLGWSKRWAWDLLNWVGPRYDLNDALVDMKLEFIAAEPDELLKKLTTCARNYGAPLVRTWVHGQPIELAFQRQQSFEALNAKDIEMESILRNLNLAAQEESIPVKEGQKE